MISQLNKQTKMEREYTDKRRSLRSSKKTEFYNPGDYADYTPLKLRKTEDSLLSPEPKEDDRDNVKDHVNANLLTCPAYKLDKLDKIDKIDINKMSEKNVNDFQIPETSFYNILRNGDGVPVYGPDTCVYFTEPDSEFVGTLHGYTAHFVVGVPRVFFEQGCFCVMDIKDVTLENLVFTLGEHTYGTVHYMDTFCFQNPDTQKAMFELLRNIMEVRVTAAAAGRMDITEFYDDEQRLMTRMTLNFQGLKEHVKHLFGVEEPLKRFFSTLFPFYGFVSLLQQYGRSEIVSVSATVSQENNRAEYSTVFFESAYQALHITRQIKQIKHARSTNQKGDIQPILATFLKKVMVVTKKQHRKKEGDTVMANITKEINQMNETNEINNEGSLFYVHTSTAKLLQRVYPDAFEVFEKTDRPRFAKISINNALLKNRVFPGDILRKTSLDALLHFKKDIEKIDTFYRMKKSMLLNFEKFKV